MTVLSYISAFLIPLSVKMLLWGLKNKRTTEIVIATLVLIFALSYMVYDFSN